MPSRARTVAVRSVLLVATVAAAVGVSATPIVLRAHPATSPRTLTVTALGDSVPSGYGCACRGYVQTVADLVAGQTRRDVTVHNDSTAGDDSSDVETTLSGAAGTHLAQSDVVLVQVGANDLDLDLLTDARCQRKSIDTCWRNDLHHLRENLFRIADRARLAPRRPLVVLVGYWNVTVDGAVADARGANFTTASDRLTAAVNRTLADVARQTHALFVDTRGPFDGADGLRDPTPDLQDDGDHPDADGHDLLADAVFDAVARTGRLERWAAAERPS